MHVQLLFGISVAFGFVAWAVVTALYIWPRLQARSRIEALRPLLALHGFSFYRVVLSGSRRRIGGLANRVRARRGLRRRPGSDFGFVGPCCTTEQVGDCARVGL